FSSRRRHTRFSRDWSSDVCSSDLIAVASQKPGRRTRWRKVRACSAMPDSVVETDAIDQFAGLLAMAGDLGHWQRVDLHAAEAGQDRKSVVEGERVEVGEQPRAESR